MVSPVTTAPNAHLVGGDLTVVGAILAADIIFKNNWKLTEDDIYGIILTSPSGKKYRLILEEIRDEMA